MKKLLLPVGLVLAVVFGIIVSTPGVMLQNLVVGGFSIKTILIMTIFVVTGYGIGRDRLRFQREMFAVIAAAIVLNLFLAPFIGLALIKLTGISEPLALGLSVFACVPTTLSSAIVITRVAGGNAFLAVTLTTVLSLLGVFTLPLTLGWVLRADSLDLNRWAIFQKILLLVLLPMLVGMGLRVLFRARRISWLSYIPSCCVILIVWMAVSGSREAILSIPPRMIVDFVLVVVFFHPTLLVLAWLASRLLRLNPKDRTALIFVASEKTLPIAVSVLAMLVTVNPLWQNLFGLATVTCVVLHFFQVMTDSTIAASCGHH
jgi:solute carrier family 10 (sodium/bile acid cotransporter), member 7